MSKQALQKLCLVGNSVHVNIARPFLFMLGWMPGDWVHVWSEDGVTLHVQRFNREDLMRQKSPGIVPENPQPAKA